MNARLNGCLTEYVEFKDISNIFEGIASCCLLVNSPPFHGVKTFDFEVSFAEILIVKLKEFYEVPHRFGPIKLASSLWEEECICFSGDELGHINVEGILIKYGDSIQRLYFSFVTDQTMLKDFIADFEVFLNKERDV